MEKPRNSLREKAIWRFGILTFVLLSQKASSTLAFVSPSGNARCRWGTAPSNKRGKASLPLGSIARRRTSRRRDGSSRKRYKVTQNRNKPGQSNSQPPPLNHSEKTIDMSVNKERLALPINCEHFDSCPGCVVNDRVGRVDIIQSSKLYFSSSSVRKGRMDVVGKSKAEHITVTEQDDFYKVIVPTSIVGWRTQAKLAVASKSSSWSRDGCVFGLYKRGTHKVLEIPKCQVHHPSINKVVQALVEATSKVKTAAYDEDCGEGGLRYIQCQVDRTTGKVCLTLIWNAEQLKQTQPALSRLTKALLKQEPDLWHSMWCHCNDGIKNNIFSRNANRWHLLWGPEFIREPIPTIDDNKSGWLYFTPSAFRQGNMDGFDVLALNVARAVPGGSRVCELYAGVGTLGLTCLSHHASEPQGQPLEWLRCSDENPANPRCFKRAVSSMPGAVTGQGSKRHRHNEMKMSDLMDRVESSQAYATRQFGKKNKKDDGGKTSYLVASASRALWEGQALGANVLIVDPPRKGLEPEVLAELCKPINPNQGYVESKMLLSIPDSKVNWTNDVQTLIYVSCGFDALARDCDTLLSSKGGGWMLKSATGYVLFPGSDHVETLCVFERR